MKQIIRMYKRHDMDLITIYKTSGISLHKAIYNSLKAYVNKDVYLIKTPEAVTNMSIINFNSHYQIILNLDDNKDADIIAWLKKIKKGMRNAAIKMVVRGCLVGTTAYACSTDDNDRIENNKLRETVIKNVINVLETPVKNNKNAKQSKTSIKTNTKTTVSEITTIEKKSTNSTNKVIQDENITKDSVLEKEPAISIPADETNLEDMFSVMSFDNQGEKAEESLSEDKNDDYDMFSDISALLNQF